MDRGEEMKIFAHRGYSGKYPENTMLAFRKAVECGADGIELDVQLSKDGVPVIFHDEKMERLTNKKGLLCGYLWEELQETVILHENFQERISSLEEYLEFIKRFDITTNIELKNSIIKYPNLEEKVLKLVEEYQLKDKIIISSFNHKSLRKVKDLIPDISCGLLTVNVIYHISHYLIEVGCDYFHPLFYTLDQEIFREVKEAGFRINTWTVNTKEELELIKGLEIDGMITNEPELFL